MYKRISFVQKYKEYNDLIYLLALMILLCFPLGSAAMILALQVQQWSVELHVCMNMLVMLLWSYMLAKYVNSWAALVVIHAWAIIISCSVDDSLRVEFQNFSLGEFPQILACMLHMPWVAWSALLYLLKIWDMLLGACSQPLHVCYNAPPNTLLPAPTVLVEASL